jgi:2-methylcitrate dehydratase PrpD
MRDSGLTAANLERLTIRMSKKGQLNVGWPYRPGEVISAQMNGCYAAAVALIDGDAFIDQYKEDRLADPRILMLLPRIEIIHDPDLDHGGAAMRHAVRIQAVLKDARIQSTSIEQRRGSVEHPLSATEITRKFRRLAGTSRSQAEIDELIETISALETQPDLHRLVQLITT